MRTLILSAVFCCLFAWLPGLSAQDLTAQEAAEWNRFRGPNGTGVGQADIPAEWTEENIHWQAKLPGLGHSSPVLWGDRLIITSGDPDTGDRIVLSFNAVTGEKQWEKKFAAPTHSLHADNSYASSSAVIDAERIYLPIVSPERYLFVALDHEGNVVWERNFGSFASKHGFGSSPMLFADLVIITNDQMEEGFLAALDRKTGETRWKVDRPGETAAYSTPAIFDPATGPPQLVVMSQASGMAGYDPASGEQIWQLSSVYPQRCVQSPLIHEGLIYGGCGQGGQGVLFISAIPGDLDREAEVNFTLNSAIPYVPTPVVLGDLLFLWHDRGTARCVDRKTGEELWNRRIGGSFHGSPVLVGDKIFCISKQGQMYVLAADREFRLLAKNDLGERSQATPAVALGKMFVRTESNLFCVGPTQ